MSYRAPVKEIAFQLTEVAGLAEARETRRFADLSDDLLSAILEEAGKFAETVLAPLNRTIDRQPPRLSEGVVTTAPEMREAFRRFTEGGWTSLTGTPDFGGQGLPQAVYTAVNDLWNQASAAFAVGPLLSMGAIEALEAHASEDLKRTYLPKLISGEWAGTMNLTEPQAGSDLNAVRTRAERAADGSYRIFGQKIYITFGEHDLTDNIVHLVLARLPDAPPGTRGISLFLVPKVLVNEDGSLGARNDVYCNGLEHKLGLHGSPTCTMIYGDGEGAVGYLVGEENRGLKCMFTMMNNARLAVGIQGVAIAERATQQALAYALERRQGKAAGYAGEGMAPIVHHPDVKRMLLEMRTLTAASRAICYATAVAIDRAHGAEEGGAERVAWQARADLLTPIAKAFSTDVGVEVTSMGVQIHGGMGYVEETGAAQHYRDARIFPIYEGTNGIQAIDLVVRKVPIADGGAVAAYLEELSAIVERARGSNREDLGAAAGHVAEAIRALSEATDRLLAWQKADPRSAAFALGAATGYLRAFGLTAGGAYLLKAALSANGGDAARGERTTAARFFAERFVRDVPPSLASSLATAPLIADLSPEALAS